MIGFSEHVDLGDVGMLRDDPTIALRFELRDTTDHPPRTRLTLRLRGTAFDAYDGRAWARTSRDLRPADHGIEGSDVYPLFRGPDSARDRVVAIDLEPIDPPVLFLPPRAVALRVRPQNQILLGEPLVIQRGAEDELRYSGSDARGLRYDVFLANDDEVLVEPLSPAERARYLARPADFPQRIGELARRWTDDVVGPDAKARRIEERLRRDFLYDLKSPSQGKPQPVDHFLFESKRGHCEFFSTSMALMLRAIGIPSRNVTGFVGGTWNRFGRYYAVREGDAHSWVEAYIDNGAQPGWRTYDPTPPGGAQPLEPPTGFYYYARDFVEALSQRWNTYVVGYDLRKQVRMFDEVSQRYSKLRGISLGRVPIAAVLVVGVLAGYAFWKRRRGKSSRAEEDRGAARRQPVHGEVASTLYRALELALQVHGVTRAASMPPLRHAEELRAHRHPLAGEVLALTNVYLETRFGGNVLTEAARRDFERRVREIRAFRPSA
jgi:transglutaminase-like putative cysteine protease